MSVNHRAKTISPRELHAKILDASQKLLILDLRTQDEQDLGKIPGATLFAADALSDDAMLPDVAKTTEILVYCGFGQRSETVAAKLAEQGFTDVSSLAGGFLAWNALNLPTEPTSKTSIENFSQQRYVRQIRLPQVGIEGQKKIAQSRILILGVGGLGCPASQYLAASGVGHLGLVDFDRVDQSNLQRQILFGENNVGELKVEAAKAALTALNHEIKITTHAIKLGSENAHNIVSDYDLVINGCDNFPTRYLINEVCLAQKKPLIDAAVHLFEGRLSVFDFRRSTSACYRCLYEKAPPSGSTLACQDLGVLGVLPGLFGVLQANEALKIICEMGQIPSNKLLIFDGLTTSFRTLNFVKNPNCSTCGQNRQQQQ